MKQNKKAETNPHIHTDIQYHALCSHIHTYIRVHCDKLLAKHLVGRWFVFLLAVYSHVRKTKIVLLA